METSNSKRHHDNDESFEVSLNQFQDRTPKFHYGSKLEKLKIELKIEKYGKYYLFTATLVILITCYVLVKKYRNKKKEAFKVIDDMSDEEEEMREVKYCQEDSESIDEAINYQIANERL